MEIFDLQSYGVSYNPRNTTFTVTEITTWDDELVTYNNVWITNDTNEYSCIVRASSISNAINQAYVMIRDYIVNVDLADMDESYSRAYTDAVTSENGNPKIYKVKIGNVNWEEYFDCEPFEEDNYHIDTNSVVMTVDHALHNSVDLITCVIAGSEEEAINIAKKRAIKYLERLIEKIQK